MNKHSTTTEKEHKLLPNSAYDLQLETVDEDAAGYIRDTLRQAKQFLAYVAEDKKKLLLAFGLIMFDAAANVITPYFVSIGIDRHIATGDLAGLSRILLILGCLFAVTIFTGYFQGITMGRISQRTLYRLRQALFSKLQELPIAFFNQNRTGDLMSRLNNDTNKLSQFLSESISRFVGMFFGLTGIGIFVFFLNWKLALVMLSSTVAIAVITRLLSPTIERLSKKSSRTLGAYSASIQENITNFKVVIAYNRREFFEQSVNEANEHNYKAAIPAVFASKVLEPIYEFAGFLSQAAVLLFGLYFIINGQLTIGVLVAFLAYTYRFYDPLRTLATILSDIQVSLAAWSRIQDILKLKSNLPVMRAEGADASGGSAILELKDMSFGYTDDKMVLENISLKLEQGKTYAIVGPTGGGKTTLSNLMARLYDPKSGQILFKGRDIRSYEQADLRKDIGVILQEPFMFSGTVAENIKYAHGVFANATEEELAQVLADKGFSHLLDRFPDGLKTVINTGAENMSLGQKQLVAFMRILLREPKLLILDEATANIDTVTESALGDIIEKLPAETTKVVIAHRLNTIRKADQIIFINGGHAESTMDFDHALNLINQSKRKS